MADDSGLEVGEDPADRFVANVHVHERNASGHVGAPAAAVLPERIDHEHVVACRDVRVDDVRPDKAGAAGNNDAHYDLLS